MKIVEFKNLNLKIELTTFTNIIGSLASGKTTLLKMLINKVPNDNLYIDDIPISNYSLEFKKSNLAVCLNDLSFNTNYVKEELLYYQTILGIEYNKAYENIKNFSTLFNLDDLLESKIEYLTNQEKALVKILSLLIFKPKVLGIDTIFCYLPLETKIKIIKFAKNNKISILNVTSCAEELLLGTDIIVLDNYQLIEYRPTKKILDNENLLKRIGFELPFAVNLNRGLNYYDLLSKKYYDNKSLVEAIWK